MRLIFVYDTLAYSLGVGSALPILLPGAGRGAGTSAAAGGRGAIDAARRIALSWPRWAAASACLGWLPGGLIFPIVLALFSGPLPWAVAVHLVDPLHPLRPDRLDLLDAAGAVDQPAHSLPAVVARRGELLRDGGRGTSPSREGCGCCRSFPAPFPWPADLDHGGRPAAVQRRRIPLVPLPRDGLDRAGHGRLSTDAVCRGTAFANPGRPDRRSHGRVSFLPRRASEREGQIRNFSADSTVGRVTLRFPPVQDGDERAERFRHAVKKTPLL